MSFRSFRSQLLDKLILGRKSQSKSAQTIRKQKDRKMIEVTIIYKK